MIEVEIHGRFGNHLFQYAFAYAMARQFNSPFKFRYSYRQSLDEIFELPSFKKPLLQKIKRLSGSIDHRMDQFFDKSNEVIQVKDIEHFTPQQNTRYKGFYQSYQFFSNYEKEIRQEFKFKKSHLDEFQNKFGELFSTKKILGVHIRQGDYLKINMPDLGNPGLQLPIQFYKENIEKLLDKNTVVFFASDDIEFVKQEFGENDPYYFSSEDMIMDFIALTKAHQLIISNSSFSWWAGFLNEQKNKQVIAPKYHLGFKVKKEIPKGIMYEGFDWTDVPYSPAPDGSY